MKSLLYGLLGLLLIATGATSGLQSLVVDGHELHPSLEPKRLDEANHGVPAGVHESPHLSADAEFVESVSRFASQGRLGGEGIRAGLFALYRCEREVGFYGLEAVSFEEADRLEVSLREIWAKNVQLERARLPRSGRVFVLVWHDGAPPDCWEGVNEALVERLAG